MGRRRREQRAGGFWGATEEIRRRAWVERTLNISLMSVTLDVSKLSGWLNAYASCKPEGGNGVRAEVRVGR